MPTRTANVLTATPDSLSQHRHGGRLLLVGTLAALALGGQADRHAHGSHAPHGGDSGGGRSADRPVATTVPACPADCRTPHNQPTVQARTADPVGGGTVSAQGPTPVQPAISELASHVLLGWTALLDSHPTAAASQPTTAATGANPPPTRQTATGTFELDPSQPVAVHVPDGRPATQDFGVARNSDGLRVHAQHQHGGHLTYGATPQPPRWAPAPVAPVVGALRDLNPLRQLRTEILVDGAVQNTHLEHPLRTRDHEFVGLTPGVQVTVRSQPVGPFGIPVGNAVTSGLTVPLPPPEHAPAPRLVNQDRLLRLQWGLARVRIPEAWAQTRQRTPATVAVIDTGVDPDHPELRGQLTNAPLAVMNGTVLTVPPTQAASTDSDHGTKVTGVISARWDDRGIAGIAPWSNVLDYRVFKGDRLPVRNLTAALHDAAERDVDVVNMSVVTTLLHDGPWLPPVLQWHRHTDLQRAVDRVHEAGTVLVAAAGNHQQRHPNAVPLPAGLRHVITVGGLERNGTRSPYSPVNGMIDLVAPSGSMGLRGRGIGSGGQVSATLTTTGNGRHDYTSGTSLAAPHVTGTIALMLGEHPGLTPDETRSILQHTARDIGPPGWDPAYGWGEVQADAAVAMARAAARGQPIPPPRKRPCERLLCR